MIEVILLSVRVTSVNVLVGVHMPGHDCNINPSSFWELSIQVAVAALRMDGNNNVSKANKILFMLDYNSFKVGCQAYRL